MSNADSDKKGVICIELGGVVILPFMTADYLPPGISPASDIGDFT